MIGSKNILNKILNLDLFVLKLLKHSETWRMGNKTTTEYKGRRQTAATVINHRILDDDVSDSIVGPLFV